MARAFKKSEFKDRKGPEGLSEIMDAKIVEGKEFGTISDPDSGQPIQPKNLQLHLSTQNLESGEKATAFIKIASPKKGELEVTAFEVRENEHGAPTILVGNEAPFRSVPFALLLESMEEADPSLPETLVPEGPEYDDDDIFAIDVAGLIGLKADFYQDEQPGVVNSATGEQGKPYYRTKVRSFHTDEEVEEILAAAKKPAKKTTPKTETAKTATTTKGTATTTTAAAKKAAKVAEPEPEPEVEETGEEAGEEEGGDDELTAKIHEAIDSAITSAINASTTKVLPLAKLPALITPFLRKLGMDNEDLAAVGPILTDAEQISEISEREGCVWERAGMQIKVRAKSADAAPKKSGFKK